MSLDLDLVRERFESSTDFTIGLEEEFAILDPETLELEHRFEDVYAACQRGRGAGRGGGGGADRLGDRDPLRPLRDLRRGGRAPARPAGAALRARRRRWGLALAATGHPSLGQLPRPADHRHAALQPPARTNWAGSRSATTPGASTCTWACAGADRAIAVCDWLRELLPLLLAARPTRPSSTGATPACTASAREIFTRTFPRCGIPGCFRELGEYADFVATLERTGVDRRVDPALVERSPAPSASARSRCGSATRRRAARSRSRWPALIAACIAQTALEYDERGYEGAAAPLRDREIEENLWRAIRYGMDGRMIDFRRGAEVEARERARAGCCEWTEPARSQLGIEVELPERNGAQRARAPLGGGALDRGDLPRCGRRDRRTYSAAGLQAP